MPLYESSRALSGAREECRGIHSSTRGHLERSILDGASHYRIVRPLLALGRNNSYPKNQPVAEAFAKLGFSDNLALPFGVIELVGIALFLIPRTSILGAVYLTAYLGGATAAQIRIDGPAWFSAIIGALLWAGILLGDAQVRKLIPFRRDGV